MDGPARDGAAGDGYAMEYQRHRPRPGTLRDPCTVLGRSTRKTFVGAAEQGAVILPPKGAGTRLQFHPIPKGQVGNNQPNADLQPSDSMRAGVARLVTLGAIEIRLIEEDGSRGTVVMDP